MLALPPSIEAMVESGRFSVRIMVRFDLDSGATGVWNDTFPVEFEGVTYAPLGGNIDFDGVPGSTTLSSESVKVVVSNLSSAVSAVLAGETWHQRPCVLFIAFMNDAGAVAHVMPWFSGFLDDASLSDAADDLAALSIFIESNNRELNRSSGRTRSDADQRRVSAGDGFFKHAANANSDTDIYWGRKGPQSPAKSSRG
jgi:hypothetical protein